FEEVKTSLKTLKSILVEFLPPYSPFLNPIKYSFQSIKVYIKSKEPPNWGLLCYDLAAPSGTCQGFPQLGDYIQPLHLCTFPKNKNTFLIIINTSIGPVVRCNRLQGLS
ncbi:hypothetical protein VP01_2916g2, partial [Puccinia sorghi]